MVRDLNLVLSQAAVLPVMLLDFRAHVTGRVSEPACFGAAPAPGKREYDFGIFENLLPRV